jgi:DNA-binding transcriptional LysR family regulator
MRPRKDRISDDASLGWEIINAVPRYNWHDIVYFLELVRHGQLVDAAKNLKVDHTTVSRRIRELERALDCKLFTRTKTGFVLTDAGLKIFEHAEAMEQQANSIAQTAGFEGTQAGGVVRIATMEGIGSFYLGPCMRRFRQQHPGILVELVTASRWINLSRREADIFISFSKPDERRLLVQKIGTFKVGLFASSDYLSRRGTPKTKADLEEHSFVDYVDDLIEITAVRWLADLVKPRQVVFRSTSLIAQYTSASKGLGIAALPTFIAVHNNDLAAVIPNLTTTRDIWLSVHQDLEHLSRINTVAKFLTAQVERDQKTLLAK